MTRIGIDYRFASTATGLGRYVRELVPALKESSSDIEWVILDPNIRHYSIAEQLRWPYVIKKAKLDLLFVPHFNVPITCRVPFVCTIHDLILHNYPNQASPIKRMMYHKVIRSTLSRAKSIISVSEFTASEIKKHYGKNSVVVPEGINPKFTRPSAGTVAEVRDRYQLSGNYFLYVGNAKEHKNLKTLIHAFVKADMRDAELILVSHGIEADQLMVSGNIRRLMNVDDSDLAALYAGARAFVTASSYEGFCLPILEARACGCPVIASNISAIPELNAEGVTLVEPTVDAFTWVFRHWEDPPHVEAPRRTWNDVASDTLDVLMKNVECRM